MKILHIEDQALEAELIHHSIRSEWPGCDITFVNSRPAFVTALAANDHDLILSDFSLPGFSGLEALQLARAQCPEIPFVFLSGTIGEDRAVEALRSGAVDYVIKDRPKRLLPALHRALDDARLARERQAAAEQLLRVQRLENIGMLAAGIAHDLNNVLAPVIMGVPLLQMRNPDPVSQRILANMGNSVSRGAGLVRQILGFARGVTGESQLIQPHHLLRELIGVIQQTFPKHIHLDDQLGRDFWPVKANPTQFHQIILNLCINARDAMAAGGTLTLYAENRELDEAGAAAIRGTRPGPYFVLEVRDTGTGIPEDIREKIWEPFFTTKALNAGSGLGLATVRGLVQDHGGTIGLDTQPGRGTTFRIFLPAHPSADGLVTAAPTAIPRGQGELILVTDDDTSVREITAATLTGHGYRVLAATDGTEGVALVAPRFLEVRAVVTDLDMPNLDGTAMVKVLLTLNPSLRVILVSGTADLDDPRRVPPPGGRFLAKPFSADMLLRTVHELIGAE